MRGKLWISLAVLAALMLPAGCGEEGGETPGAGGGITRILLVQSYHPEYQWVADINRGFTEGLAKANLVEGTHYELEIMYMDTKRNPDQASIDKATSEVMAKVEEWKPSIVIVCDDNALKTVGKQLLGREGVSVVFVGINNDPVKDYNVVQSMDKPGTNVTGVVERERFKGTVELLRQFYPAVARVYFIQDDSATARPVVERSQALCAELGLEAVVKTVTTFSDWKAAALEANAQGDFIYLTQYHTLDGGATTPEQVMEWNRANVTIPMAGAWNFNVQDGGLCGEVISGYYQGEAAAQIVKKIINGVDVANIPVPSNVDGEPMVNSTAAQRLGLTINEAVKASANVLAGL